MQQFVLPLSWIFHIGSNLRYLEASFLPFVLVAFWSGVSFEFLDSAQFLASTFNIHVGLVHQLLHTLALGIPLLTLLVS